MGALSDARHKPWMRQCIFSRRVFRNTGLTATSETRMLRPPNRQCRDNGREFRAGKHCEIDRHRRHALSKMQQIPTANPWLAAVEPSPIGETKRWVLNRTFPAERPLIDLSQAVPGYPPAIELRRHLGELLLDPTMHGYTPILGLPALRENYAAHLSGFYGAPITAGEVGITSGCNQAFCLALMSIAKAGDQVILPRPHYFNHDMWMRMQGVEPVSLDFRPGSGAVPNAEDAAKLIGPKTRAIVLISPNNPTGAVYPRETIHAFYELAQRSGIALLLDETYKDFLPEGTRPHELFSDPAWRRTLVHLYSFSKVFALTGYRVGGVAAGAALISEIEKAMDCVSICPPRLDRKSTRLNSSHSQISYAVFCL